MASKVQVNGNSSGVEPNIQSQITTALLQNGGVKRIQDTLQQRLDEEGWSEALRKYVVEIFRGGEATTYDEALAKVMQQIRSGQNGTVSNGASGAHAADLSVPESAKTSGVEAVKKELMGICEMEK